MEQSNGEREREISRKERDVEQLRKENQVSPKVLGEGERKRKRSTHATLAGPEGPFERGDGSNAGCRRRPALAGRRRRHELRSAGSGAETTPERKTAPWTGFCLTEGAASQVLLRMKENEIEYLHKEMGCLRNELQFLNTVLTPLQHIYGPQAQCG